MASLDPIDLHFLGVERSIGVYVVETTDGLALYDCGPATTVERLHEGLRERGLELTDIRHLLLSHIHFDHSGAAGVLVREHPDLKVWVSEIGAPHLIEPERLEASARRVWGDRFDALWGELTPVPESNIRLAKGDVLGWEAFPTPGHASHHVCYLRDGVLLAGDACGVRPLPANYVLPVSPPPDIDVEGWHRSIDAIEERGPNELALIHFGVAEDAAEHLVRLRQELDLWTAFIDGGADQETFVAWASERADADPDLYVQVVTLGQSWQGLRRYLDKREEAA
jgi:glyoxylase-like metal-dependent hydrolase (beta-lactamase superfamily II)